MSQLGAPLREPQRLAKVESVLRELPSIAISGKAGAGKTTAAGILENAGYQSVSIADPLKDIAEEVWGVGARKDRDILQPLGQRIRQMDEDAWSNLAIRRMQEAGLGVSGKLFVIDDLRFPNEYHALRTEGFIVVRIEARTELRIVRLQNNGKLQNAEQLGDISETALDDAEFDYVIENNGTWSEFVKLVLDMLRKERARS